jgi:hypothetical protein
VSTPYNTLWRPRSGRVEGARRRSAPIDQQPVIGRAGDADPADVELLVIDPIDPAEAQTLLDAVELGDPVLEHAGPAVPLGAALMGQPGDSL